MLSDLFLAVLFCRVVTGGLVFWDAWDNSSQSAALWALVVGFGGAVLGTLLYLLLGREQSLSLSDRFRRRATADGSDEPMNVDDSGPF